MTDIDRSKMNTFSDRLADTLRMMDVEDFTEATFDCPFCDNTVKVRLFENGDAIAGCETDDCVRTGVIHRRGREW